MKYFKTIYFSNILKTILFFTSLILLFFFSSNNLVSVKNTTNIFLFSVFPSLFPFILFTEILLNTNFINTFFKIFENITYKLFKINKNSTQSIIIGFLCGYPMGAKSVISSYSKNKISYNEGKILLSFVNNCNPIFILSTICLNIFKNYKIGIILLFAHLLSSILIGIFYSRITNHDNIIHKNNTFLNSFNKKNDNIHLSSFDILKKSIKNTFITLEMIFGFMIVFNLLSSIVVLVLNKCNIPNYILAIISGLFEVTGGSFYVSSLNINIIAKICIISFLLGFSGLCIIFQIYSVIYTSNFKLSSLLFFKLLHGILSSCITYILITLFKDQTITVFNNSNTIYTDIYSMFYLYIIFFLLITFILIYFSIKKAVHKK